MSETIVVEISHSPGIGRVRKGKGVGSTIESAALDAYRKLNRTSDPKSMKVRVAMKTGPGRYAVRFVVKSPDRRQQDVTAYWNVEVEGER